MVWVMVRGMEETEKGRERVGKTREMVSTEMTKGMGYRQFQPYTLVTTHHVSHRHLKGRDGSRDSGQWRDRWRDRWAKKKVRYVVDYLRPANIHLTLLQGEWEAGDGSSEADRDEYFKKVIHC